MCSADVTSRTSRASGSRERTSRASVAVLVERRSRTIPARGVPVAASQRAITAASATAPVGPAGPTGPPATTTLAPGSAAAPSMPPPSATIGVPGTQAPAGTASSSEATSGFATAGTDTAASPAYHAAKKPGRRPSRAVRDAARRRRRPGASSAPAAHSGRVHRRTSPNGSSSRSRTGFAIRSSLPRPDYHPPPAAPTLPDVHPTTIDSSAPRRADGLPPPGTRVIVGMSGGVDSSVTALLLARAGLDVSGVFMRNWEDDDDACTARQDYRDAAGVAARLGIELEHVNFAEEYWAGVFEHFLAEYRAGRTPNPDVLCNREIKFKAFLDHAVARGADMIATGHYVRGGAATPRVDGPADGPGDDGPALLRGLDPAKDQSYFLYQLGRRALGRSVFPVGALAKPAVRALARDAGFALHAKKDSTGICFIGERKFSAFLADYLPAAPGDIVTDAGDVVGRHSGLMFHTHGQRQGLGIGGRAGADAAPWYVVAKDLAENRLVVGQGHAHPMLMRDALEAGDLHWVAGRPPADAFRCTARVRYRQDDVPATVRTIDPGEPGATSDGAPLPGTRVAVRFDAPMRAITPGQAVVFYDGDRCLGGGTIEAFGPSLAERPEGPAADRRPESSYSPR